MFDFIIAEVAELPTIVHVLVIIVLFIFAPLLFIPIMSIALLSGLSYGIVNGLLLALLGYFFSTIFYYYLGQYIHNIKYFKKRIVLYKLRYKELYIDSGVFAIAFLALFVPFIILVPLLGAIKKRKRLVVSGLIIGSFPSIFLSVLSGSMAQQFSATQDKIYILYAFLFILALYIISKIINKKIKPKGLKHE